MASFQAQAQDAHTLLYHDASKRSRVMPISEHMQPRRNFKHFCQCMCSSESFLGFKNTLKEYFIHCLYFGVLLLLPLEWWGLEVRWYVLMRMPQSGNRHEQGVWFLLPIRIMMAWELQTPVRLLRWCHTRRVYTWCSSGPGFPVSVRPRPGSEKRNSAEKARELLSPLSFKTPIPN